MTSRSLLGLLCAALLAGAGCGSEPADRTDQDATTVDDTGTGGDSDFDVDAIDDAGTPDTDDDTSVDIGIDTEPDADVEEDTEPDVVIPPGCGNGVVDDGEECDDGDANSNETADACRLDCTLPSCGDGVTDTDEGCDDGDANADDTPDACRLDCSLPTCGDGVTDSGEACDDGNDDDTDACGTSCVIAGADLCAPCTDDDECGRSGDACTSLGDASFCTIACGADDACPSGLSCDTELGQCLPASGTCGGCIDEDGDGYGIGDTCLGFDCDDTRDVVYVGADEICDGFDNDCDGLVDEDALDAPTWYIDGDEDGYGRDDSAVTACTAGDEYTTTEGGDCDDDDPAINPGAADACDGIDNDCSDETPDGIGDELAGFPCDGLDEDLCPSGRTTCVNVAIVCVEEASDLLEVCDGFDNDCNPDTPDGSEDEAVGEPCDGDDTDLCTEGTATCVDGALLCSDDSGDSLELCNGADDDCDGFVDNDALDAPTWYRDTDEDLYGDDDTAIVTCMAPTEGNWVTEGGDCDDALPEVSPAADEVCNAIDDNCDDIIDTDAIDLVEAFTDGDGDGYGPDDTGELFCEAPDDRVTEGGDCNDDPEDGGADQNPGLVEICDDGIDNDCNGGTDCSDPACSSLEICVDSSCVTYPPIEGVGTPILTGTTTDQENDTDAPCVGGQGAGGADIGVIWTVPATGQYTINTLGSDYDTVLYLLDTSCDGESLVCNDDAFGGSGGGPDGLLSQVTPPLEAGQQIIIVVDGYGNSNGDFELNIELDADEICDNGVDDDLDGDLDCLDDECLGAEVCTEDCTNGVDDDGDGDIDCADTACGAVLECRPDTCGDDALGFVYGEGVAGGTLDADEWTLSCGEPGGNDASFSWTAEGYTGPVTFTVSSGMGSELAVSTFGGCDGDLLTCGTDGDALSPTFFVEDGDEVVVVVDSPVGGGGDYTVDIAIAEAGRCENGLDEDLDGDVDCDDADCFGDPVCIAAFCPLGDIGTDVGLEVLTGSTDGLPDIAEGSCNTNNLGDAVYTWTAPEAGEYEFNTLGSNYDTFLFFTDGCGGEELACNDDGADYAGTGERLRSQIVREFEADETIFVNITGFGNSEGDFVLNIIRPEICGDGFDNDFDGDTDCEDSDCAEAEGCFEICDNGIDDNDDEAVDCADVQCADLPICEEDCENGVDDNADGATDCADLQCVAEPVCCEADVFEPNTGNAGAPSTVDDVFYATEFDALTLPTGDVDSFRITTCPGAVVEASATFSHDDGNVDLRLLNQFGQLLASSVSETDDEALTYTVETITVVFLQAYIEGDAAVCTSYDLDFSVTGCDPP